MIDSKDEIMISNFFEQASKMEIEDDGFSQRVIKKISPRPNWAYRLWTAACIVGIVAYAIAMKVPQLVMVYLEVAVRTTMVSPERLIVSLPLLSLALIVTSTFVAYRTLSRV